MTTTADPIYRVLHVTFVALLIACILVLAVRGILAAVGGRMDSLPLVTNAALGGMMLALGGLLSTVPGPSGRRVPIAWLTLPLVVATSVDFVVTATLARSGRAGDDAWRLFVMLLAAAAVSVIFARVAVLETPHGILRFGRWIAPTLLVPWTLVLFVTMWSVGTLPGRAVEQLAVLLAFTGLPLLAALVAVPMLIRFTGRRRPAAETIDRVRPRLEMTCPACAFRQHLTAGHARCVACRRRLEIEIEEPRCACGYLLFRLSGSRCPECGEPV